MTTMLKILIVEDSQFDIDMIMNELDKDGYAWEAICVDTEASYLNALFNPIDLILAKDMLPQFSALRALELLQERHLGIPFIVIFDNTDGKEAIQAIRKGAADYILKDRMGHLTPAIELALTAKTLRQENKRVEQALQESEAKYRNLVQQAMVGIILVDEKGIIVEWNKGIEVITGIPKDQAILKSFVEVQFKVTIPELKTPERYKYFNDAFFRAIELRDAPWFRYVEVQKIVRTDGAFRFIEWQVFPVETEHAFWLCSVIRDITGSVEAEQEIRRQAERAEALMRVTNKLTANLDMERVLDAVCKETAQSLNVPMCMVMLYEPEHDQLVQRAFYSTLALDEVRIPPVPLQEFETGAPSNRPVTIITDVRSHTDWELTKLYVELDARTVVLARMNYEDRLVGILVISTSGEARYFSDEELLLLTGFANHAAIAINNSWLFEQVSDGRENLQALSHRLVEVQEEERRFLARELHDEIGQTLTGLKMLFDSLPDLPGPISERVKLGRSLTKDLIERTRMISLDLRPSILDDLGLLPTLLWHFDRCSKQSLLEIDFKHSGLERRFPAAIETAAYRIIQEGCTNIIRYAQVDRASIRIWVDTNELRIELEDKGVGFDNTLKGAYKAGGGLHGMAERASLLGGYLVIRSVPKEGTKLIARLPLQDHIERRDHAR